MCQITFSTLYFNGQIQQKDGTPVSNSQIFVTDLNNFYYGFDTPDSRTECDDVQQFSCRDISEDDVA